MEKTYKIVKIIDDQTLVINAGYDDDIEIGDQFEIYSTGEEIKDPDTNEVLGTLDHIKERVEAVDVFEKMCICRHNILVNFLQNVTNNLTRIEPKVLNVDSSQISGGLSNDDVIKIGDKARIMPRLQKDSPLNK